jgi:hypothetical protein
MSGTKGDETQAAMSVVQPGWFQHTRATGIARAELDQNECVLSQVHRVHVLSLTTAGRVSQDEILSRLFLGAAT